MPSLACKGGVGEGFAVPGTIWYDPGRIRTVQMVRFYEFAQPFVLSYLVPRIPTLRSGIISSSPYLHLTLARGYGTLGSENKEEWCYVSH